jgi:hypothetical protein
MDMDKIINKIKRQITWTDGIDSEKKREWYVEFRDTTGRDIVQESVNIFATNKPKFEVVPRGIGDKDKAEQFERVIEWYMWKAAQYGRKPFHSEALTHAVKYNRVCSQLQWLDDGYFCIKNYHPSSIKYEYGSKLQWVAVVNNVSAISLVEHWQDWKKDRQVGAALKKIEALIEDNEEQCMVYVDYTDKKERLTYCYPVSDESVDEGLGIVDGKKIGSLITIQEKRNALGFINWAISDGEGDALLVPLEKGLYDAINDIQSVKFSTLMRRGIMPPFIKEGLGEVKLDFTGDEGYIEVPTGVRLTDTHPQPIDPAISQASAELTAIMNKSLQLQNVSSQSVSNVQHSTLDAQIKMWLAQLEPPKRCVEKNFEKLAILMFEWAKVKKKVLEAFRMNTTEAGSMGALVLIESQDINLNELYLKCEILQNNPTDMMQRVNNAVALKQAGFSIPDDEALERLDLGTDPAILRRRYEEQQLRNVVLEAKMKEILAEVDVATQAKIMELQAMIQQQQQQPQGGIPGDVPPDQNLASEGMTQGQGFNAAQGGTPPQAATPEITQGMGVS